VNCANCNSEFNFSEAISPKRGALKIFCECPKCRTLLSNNPIAEATRGIGIFILFFGVLSYGGTYPVPLLTPALSTIITIVGLVSVIYGFKNAKFTSNK